MKIIGIDPGLSGAIAVLENNKVIKIKMVEQVGVGCELFDIELYRNLI